MDVLTRLGGAAQAAFDGEPVLFAYLFGSYATHTARRNSDIDVAVYLDDTVPPLDYLDASLRLARLLAEASGLGQVEALVILNEAPLPLAGRIRRDRRILYSRDEVARVRYESLIARLYHDFRLREAPRDRERLRAIAEGRR